MVVVGHGPPAPRRGAPRRDEDPTPTGKTRAAPSSARTAWRARGYIAALTKRDPSGQLVVVSGASHAAASRRAAAGRPRAARAARRAAARRSGAGTRRADSSTNGAARRERAAPPAQPSPRRARRHARRPHARRSPPSPSSATALATITTAPDVHAPPEEPHRRRRRAMAAPLAAAAQAEPAAERLGRARQQPAPRLARVVAPVQRPPAVSARLLAPPARRSPRRSPSAPQRTRIPSSNGSNIVHLRSRQLGGEPLGTTLNKFSEGLRLSAPRGTRSKPRLGPSTHVALLNAREGFRSATTALVSSSDNVDSEPSIGWSFPPAPGACSMRSSHCATPQDPAHRLDGEGHLLAAMKTNFTRSPSRRRWPLLLNVALHLQPLVLTTEPRQLLALSRRQRLRRALAGVNLRPLHPLAQRGLGQIQVLRDLRPSATDACSRTASALNSGVNFLRLLRAMNSSWRIFRLPVCPGRRSAPGRPASTPASSG